jgi:hypothetical protein
LHEQLGVEHDKIAETIATIGKLTEPKKEVVKEEEDSDEEL